LLAADLGKPSLELFTGPRQNASDVVRRAERGEAVTVRVNGRPVARPVPVDRDQWRRWEHIADTFAGPADEEWDRDRNLVDQELTDRFEA
jgi:prevent-host-death family protein